MPQGIENSFVLQHEQSDCGVACLASIVRYFQGDVALERLRLLSGTSKKGTTLLGLWEASRKLGFDAEGLEIDALENLSALEDPAILHVVLEDNLQHFVVYYGMHPKHPGAGLPGDDLLVIGDPAKGICYYSKDQLWKIWKTRALLSLRPNANFLKAALGQRDTREWMLEWIKKDIPILSVSIILGICVAVLGLSSAIYSQQLIDIILPDGNVSRLMITIAIMVLLLLARSGLDYLRGFFILRQGIDLNTRIIQKFYGNLLYLPKLFFDTRRVGECIARMNDTERIQQVVSFMMSSFAIDMLVLLVSFSFVFTYSWWVGVLSVVMLPVYGGLLYSFSHQIMESQRELMRSYAITESHYVDTLQGISAIKACRGESFFEQINRRVYGLFQTRRFNLGKLNIRFGFVSSVMSVLYLGSVFALSAWLVLIHKIQMGEMVAILTLAGGLVPSLNRLATANIQIQGAKVALDRMIEFTGVPPEHNTDNPEGLNGLSVEKIELKDLSFRFPGEMDLLKNVSLFLRRGESIVLLGESGGGKSTLLQLMLKLYAVESGDIFVNDVLRFCDISTNTWRSRVGFIPQEVKLFNGNILYNLGLTDDRNTLNALIRFCSDFRFDSYFLSLPQGYQTIIGEEGINLSGGQRQLVGIVRALFTRPDFVIIDEGTSSMDRVTENFVLDVLDQMKGEMGILMATHRIKIASHADRVYVLENGSITSEGSPRELLRFENMYSDSFYEMISLK